MLREFRTRYRASRALCAICHPYATGEARRHREISRRATEAIENGPTHEAKVTLRSLGKRECSPSQGVLFSVMSGDGWCCKRGLNSRPLPYQGRRLSPQSIDYAAFFSFFVCLFPRISPIPLFWVLPPGKLAMLAACSVTFVCTYRKTISTLFQPPNFWSAARSRFA
jgi:hypothetical protein